MSQLTIKNLSVGNAQNVLIENINLNLVAPQMLAVMGLNGVGKSTLVRTILGLQKSLEGEVHLNGINISSFGFEERAFSFSCVLTEKIEEEYLKVSDVIEFGTFPYSYSMDENKKIVREVALSLKIDHLLKSDFKSLSDGQKQKVMLARCLAQNTPVIILDEPTTFLDIPSKKELFRNLRELSFNQKKIIILTTHDLENALSFCDQVMLINQYKTNLYQCSSGPDGQGLMRYFENAII